MTPTNSMCSQCNSYSDGCLSRLGVEGNDERGNSNVVSQIWCASCFEKAYAETTKTIEREVTPEQIKFEQEFEALQSQHFMDNEIIERWVPDTPNNMAEWYRYRYKEAQKEIRALNYKLKESQDKIEKYEYAQLREKYKKEIQEMTQNKGNNGK